MRKLLVAFLLALACAPALPAEFKKEQDCVPGAKVTNRQDKTGTVVSASGGMCRIRFDDGSQASHMFWMLRPAGAAIQAADKLVNGVYPCYSLSGTTLNYMFMDIQIDGPSAYRDKKGNRGTYKLEPATGKIVFESGPLTKANAKLLPGPKIGLNTTGGRFFNTTCSLKK